MLIFSSKCYKLWFSEDVFHFKLSGLLQRYFMSAVIYMLILFHITEYACKAALAKPCVKVCTLFPYIAPIRCMESALVLWCWWGCTGTVQKMSCQLGYSFLWVLPLPSSRTPPILCGSSKCNPVLQNWHGMCIWGVMHVGGMESCTILGFISAGTWCTPPSSSLGLLWLQLVKLLVCLVHVGCSRAAIYWLHLLYPYSPAKGDKMSISES